MISRRRLVHCLMAAVLGLTAGTALPAPPPAAAQPAGTGALPGNGVRVIPAKTTLAEETFQTLLVARGLQQLGYSVGPIQELDLPAAHLAVAEGDATFLADHWLPSHQDYYRNAGAGAKLWRSGVFIPDNINGYLIDKKTADAYGITNIAQMSDPKIARLFDTDGNGRANLTGCPPGWGCEKDIESHLDAYGLRPSIDHVQGDYAAMMADAIARYKLGKPIFYYTWMPYWVSNVLKPGRDVVFLQVPFSGLKVDGKIVDSAQPNGKNYGWPLATQHIVANRRFIDANPAAKSFMSHIHLAVADINSQNQAMHEGANKPADIERHVQAWIRAHQAEWDDWIAQALAAAGKTQ